MPYELHIALPTALPDVTKWHIIGDLSEYDADSAFAYLQNSGLSVAVYGPHRRPMVKSSHADEATE